VAGSIDAVIFDTDGVITKTAAVHMAAWKRLFDDELQARAEPGEDIAPFTDDDYRRYVDGKARYDGVADFLASRGIELPRGEPADAPGRDTVCALGNLKNGYFLDEVDRLGVEPFMGTVRFVERLHDHGVRTAVISASKNCAQILAAAGVDHLFEVRVDGTHAEELGLPGKPDPAVFIEAASRLGVPIDRAAIVEDAIAGVEAGRRGDFGLVIGVDRTGHPEVLAPYADFVVPDLADVAVDDTGIHRAERPIASLPDLSSALGDHDVERRLEGRRPAVFLDYDGTMTPIVQHPKDALLAPASLGALERLADRAPVGIISGRDLDDVRGMVDTDRIWFAGSHGFDVLSPDGEREDFEEGRRLLPALDEAEAALQAPVAEIPGAWVERKRFAIAVHYRQTPDEHVPALEAIVAEVAAAESGLRMVGGKKIFELRPDIPWDKGKALLWVLEAAGFTGDEYLPVYIGDDVTDEDAFLAIRDGGLAIVVGDEDRETAAHFRLDDTDQVREFLNQLVELADSTRE
jgi:alpha,alpha-trehalase